MSAKCFEPPIRVVIQLTRSLLTPSVVLASSYGFGVMPSKEGRTLDSALTFSGSFPSSFCATSFSNWTSRSGFEASWARCRNGTSCRGEDLEGTLGRHVVAVVDVRVLDVVNVAIDDGLLARLRFEAARSGLDVRSIVVAVSLC